MSALNDLQNLQQAQGALFEAGASQPASFGNPQAESAAATSAAVLFDLGLRTQLELTGADRQKYLHNFCTNEIRNLRPGQSCEAFVTTIQGKIKAQIFVFAEENSLWVDANPGFEDLLFAHFDKYLITEDVQFFRRSAECLEFYASGPEVLSRLAGLGLPVAELAASRHVRVTLDSQPVSVRRVDWLGAPGCLIQVPATAAAAVWKSLTAGGLVPAGKAVYDSLRIMAGFPDYGIDLTDDNLAQEAARTNLAISFTKGCYLGQEPIARIDSMGHVNQELRTLRLQAGPAPEAGAKVLMPGEVREAGVITSSAWDYAADAPVALALIKRNYLSPGTKLNVVCGEQEVAATVFARPQ
ncbi:MAG: glycine cleavage T C-terminal barrel domain-containing protein [Planctomycetota bacterium]